MPYYQWDITAILARLHSVFHVCRAGSLGCAALVTKHMEGQYISQLSWRNICSRKQSWHEDKLNLLWTLRGKTTLSWSNWIVWAEPKTTTIKQIKKQADILYFEGWRKAGVVCWKADGSTVGYRITRFSTQALPTHWLHCLHRIKPQGSKLHCWFIISFRVRKLAYKFVSRL